MKNFVLLASIACIVACTPGGDDAASAGGQIAQSGPGDAGQLAYDAFCASCHDTGKDDAPVRGRAEDWSDRSQLWQAVLMEHAKKGYLDMPAKGGTPELSDETVAIATEYILESTFIDRPPD
ncbi:MAG: c-type cytochrome [Gammaproteobacteria bacterium]|nr:c-type cytochrome [Gammaproteobacteria bacterium]